MKRNMGRADRVARSLVLAPAAAAVGVAIGPATVLSWFLYGFAGVMLITGATGYCLLYSVFGISTRRLTLHRRRPLVRDGAAH